MKYRKKLCSLLLVILLLFAACTPEKPDASLSSDEATLFSMADNRKSCETLIQDTPTLETIYKYPSFGAYFSARAHSGRIYTIADVNAIQKIECLRRKDNGDYYAVFQPKEGGRVYTFFAKQDAYLMSHSIYLLEPLDRNAFEKLQAGDTFADVLPLDPAIRKCRESGIWCNVIGLHGFYSVHLFEDTVALISYEETSDDVPPEQMVIREVKWFENRELFIDAPENLIHGAYDYSILPQDYVS